MSLNEELQSSNEELETSKEELQSLNEELQTVNLEVHTKVEELDRANNDLKNLIESTQIATLFLDRDLRVGTFTPAVCKILRLIPGDLGRPITDIVHDLPKVALDQIAKTVIATEKPVEFEARSKADETDWVVRVLPYKDADGHTSGVVMTLVDVSFELKPYVGRAEGVTVNGPGLLSKPKAAVTLGLVLHEMCTNAAKYGALAAPGRRLAVTWSIEGFGEDALLRLEWTESGGAGGGKPPEKTGFGTRVINQNVEYELGGDVRVDFRPEGVAYVISVPASSALLETSA